MQVSPPSAASGPVVNIASNDQQHATITLDTVAGGDIIKNYNYKDDALFYDITADSPDAAYFAPLQTRGFVEILKRKRVLLLSSDRVDTTSLAHHIAWVCKSHLEQLSMMGADKVRVLRWHNASDTQRLVDELQNQRDINIIILTGAEVSFLDNSLIRAFASSPHYLLLATERLDSKLASFDGNIVFRPTLAPDKIYNQQALLAELTQQMEQHRIPMQMLPSDSIERLATPRSVYLFSAFIAAEKGVPSKERIEQLIRDSLDQKASIKQWFYKSLHTREQLLALGLAMLDGLYEEQFFVVIEKIVDHGWKRRDNTLVSIDYGDLENLYFFDIADGAIFKSKSPDFRRILMQFAWKTHRRQILLALPVLVDVVRDTINSHPSNPSLYGTAQQRDQLRKVISETISDIGLLSMESIEPALFDLARHPHPGMKTVAARTMARWYDPSDNRRFSTATRKWYDLPKSNPEDVQNVNATVALAIGYALRDEKPDRISDEMLDLFTMVVRNPAPIVRTYVRYQVFPMVLPKHFNQIKSLFYQLVMANDAHLHIVVSESLGRAYTRYSQEVQDIVDSWLTYAKKLRNSTDSQEMLISDILLEVLVQAYIHIWFAMMNAGIMDLWAPNRIITILRMNQDDIILKIVFKTLESFLASYPTLFIRVEPLIRKIVFDSPPEYTPIVAKMLTVVYLEQRKRLQGGTLSTPIHNVRYATWPEHMDRPLTDVEKVMFRWMKDASYPTFQKLTAQAFFQFAVQLDRAEDRVMEEARNSASPDAAEEVVLPAAEEVPLGFYLGTVVPFIVTWRDKAYYRIIKGIWPEVWSKYQSNNEIMGFVVRKLQLMSYTADDDVYTIATLLRRSIDLARYEKQFERAVTYGLVGFIVCVLGFLSFRYIPL